MSDAAIKREFLKQEIVPWDESYLYHGTPPSGLACVLAEGLACVGSHDLEFCLLSTSNNDNVLTMFSDGHKETGFVFNPKFKKVLILDEFWYDALYGMSDSGGGDMWDDHVAENPEDDERAQAMGLWDGSKFKYSSISFLEKFLPKDVEAIMFPGFRQDRGSRAESEMAVTEAGMKVLEKSIEYIYIEGKEFDSAAAAKKYLEETGVECERENPPRLTAEVFGQAVHKTVWSKKGVEILDKCRLNDWQAGGCYGLALALTTALGLKTDALYAVADGQHITQHIVVKIGNYYFDSRGAHTSAALMKYWREEERITGAHLMPLKAALVSEDVLESAKAAKALAVLMLKNKTIAAAAIRIKP